MHIALSINESIYLVFLCQLVSLLQWHRQCNDLLIALSISESICLSVHMQLVSLLQWHHQCNDLLITLSISESICLPVHMQLVSLLQWHLFLMQWFIYSHRFIYQWIDSSISSHATSESASMTSSMQWSSHRSIYQWIDSPTSSHATSESASMTFILNAMIYLLTSLYLSVNRFAHQFTCN